MATLHLRLQARLDGCQPVEKNKPLSTRSCKPVFLKYKDVSPRRALRVVAQAVADIVVETKKSAGEPLSRVARKQLKWERMMKEIEVSGSAVAILSSRKEDGKIAKSDVLGTLIRLRQLDKWAMVLEVLVWLKKQDWWSFGVQDFNLIIAAYGKLGQPENAESSFTEMREAGLEPNVACFTSLLEAHARADNFERAESIYKEMVETGPAPTEVTYHVYINALCKVGLSQALESTVVYQLKAVADGIQWGGVALLPHGELLKKVTYTFRAGAFDQLKQNATKAKIPFYAWATNRFRCRMCTIDFCGACRVLGVGRQSHRNVHFPQNVHKCTFSIK